MKKFLIILTFLFISIFAYSDSAISYSKSVNIDFDVRVMMGLTKIEENDNPKYKKFLDYIDENLAKKGEVKYSHKLNMDKKVVEFFSERGELLLTENLPKEFLDIVDRSIRVAENKEEIKKTIKNIYEDPYTYVSISKYKENLILFTEENMVNRGKIKNTISVVLKRELTDNEKNELIYLKNNDNDEFFNKYRTYIDSETTKTYINDKLELFQEIKGLTEITILYKNEISKVVIEYSDNSRINSVVKSYRNDRLLNETFFKNKDIVLEKEYYANGKLAREIPLKDGLINGEVKDYYENGKIRSTATFVNGDIDGIVKEYNQAGKVIKETLYKNGKKVK
ncbi:toxin-antitoxin system YwqK family antitoxin [Fusobacterium hwasookii]